MLPNFSCHSLRHTFVTRLVEADVSIPVIQRLAGHSRSDVTLDVYTTVTKEFQMREFDRCQEKVKQQEEEWKQRTTRDIAQNEKDNNKKEET